MEKARCTHLSRCVKRFCINIREKIVKTAGSKITDLHDLLTIMKMMNAVEYLII